jgi:hypothetical protein
MAVSDNHRTEAPTRRGVHERLGALPPAGEPVPFDPRRTLPLRIEFIRQLKRRRTQLVALVLLLLPILVAIAFKVGGQQTSGGAALVDIATTGATNFALFTEFAAIGFLLVVIVALFCGDTVASEASWSSLRYLLAVPVPRSRLLRQKLVVSLTLSFGANLLLPLWGYVVGGLFFGWAPARSPLGGSFTTSEAVTRLVIVVGYACVQSLVVAGLAFLLGRPARCGRRRGAARRGVQHPRLDLGVGSVPAIPADALPVLVARRAGPGRRLGRHAPRDRVVVGLRRRVSGRGLGALPAQGHHELTSVLRAAD